MKRFVKNITVVTGVIIVTGIIRFPLEQIMRDDMRKDKILAPAMSMSERNELGQAGYAAALGGLRPVLASYYYLKAHNLHTDRNWYEMAKALETIVAMQPDTEYYWDMAGWHMAYNTSSLCFNNLEVGPLERIRLRDHYIEVGDDFLKRGLKHIPNSILLKSERVRLLTDIFRKPDFKEAVNVSKSLLKQDDLTMNEILMARAPYVYNLSSLPGREVEAYEEALRLWNLSNDWQRIPTLRVIIYTLQKKLNLPKSEIIRDEELLFNPNTGRELVGLYGFVGSAKLSDEKIKRQKLKNLYNEWERTPFMKRTDILRAQITILELLLNQKSKIEESQFYLGEEHRAYIKKLASIRASLDATKGSEVKVYQDLKHAYKRGTLTRFQKMMLWYIQQSPVLTLKKADIISDSELLYDPLYSYNLIKNYWNNINNEVISAIEKGNEGMRYRPTDGLLEELQAMEDKYNVPIGQRIQSHTIYEDQPFVK